MTIRQAYKRGNIFLHRLRRSRLVDQRVFNNEQAGGQSGSWRDANMDTKHSLRKYMHR